MAAATDVWPDHGAHWSGRPGEPEEDEEQTADADPPESDGYEPI